MNSYHIISSEVLDLATITTIISERKKLKLSEGAISRITKCRAFLDKKLKGQNKPIYGINTGFGALYNVKISKDNLTILQENLVMSHGCGTGDRVPDEVGK